jgi:hypothetical protein
MDPETFKKVAGSDARIAPGEMREAVEAAVPDCRNRLLPKVREYADRLTTSLDMIAETHRLAGQKLAEWIASNYRPGQSLDVVLVCSANSRRSILGATMGNMAAAYYGMPGIRFHSGGTAPPTAFNIRTVRALEEVGVEVEPTGEQASRGAPDVPNPVYRVRWGLRGETVDPSLEAIEFSKHYRDPTNPREGFAALLVCADDDGNCPFVEGAAVRMFTPYVDPKIYDGGAYEAAKYAERRDDLGRLMLAVMMQARARVAPVGTPAGVTR